MFESMIYSQMQVTSVHNAKKWRFFHHNRHENRSVAASLVRIVHGCMCAYVQHDGVRRNVTWWSEYAGGTLEEKIAPADVRHL